MKRPQSQTLCTFGQKEKDYQLLYRKDLPPPNLYNPKEIKSEKEVG